MTSLTNCLAITKNAYKLVLYFGNNEWLFTEITDHRIEGGRIVGLQMFFLFYFTIAYLIFIQDIDLFWLIDS